LSTRPTLNVRSRTGDTPRGAAFLHARTRHLSDGKDAAHECARRGTAHRCAASRRDDEELVHPVGVGRGQVADQFLAPAGRFRVTPPTVPALIPSPDPAPDGRLARSLVAARRRHRGPTGIDGECFPSRPPRAYVGVHYGRCCSAVVPAK
jgi:hypothetical protein